MMRRSLRAVSVCLLALALPAAPASAEDSAGASPCALAAIPPPPQADAPPGYVASMRRRIVGWVYPQEQADAALARLGGLRLVLHADSDVFRAALLDDLRGEVRCLMREAHIGLDTLAVRNGGVELQLQQSSDAARARTVLASVVPAGAPPGAGDMRDSGSGLIRLAPTPTAYDALLGQALDRAVEIIRRRLNEFGMKSAGVQRDGVDRIVVMLPGIKDAAHVARLATARGRLEFRLVDTSLPPQVATSAGVPPGSELVRQVKSDQRVLVRREAALTGRDIADAHPDVSPNSEPVVTFRFTPRGTRAFGLFTRENVGRPFAIVFDGEVLSAPIIREPILGGFGQISGSFTIQQANDLAVLLRVGMLPLDLNLVEQKTVESAPK